MRVAPSPSASASARAAGSTKAEGQHRPDGGNHFTCNHTCRLLSALAGWLTLKVGKGDPKEKERAKRKWRRCVKYLAFVYQALSLAESGPSGAVAGRTGAHQQQSLAAQTELNARHIDARSPLALNWHSLAQFPPTVSQKQKWKQQQQQASQQIGRLPRGQ